SFLNYSRLKGREFSGLSTFQFLSYFRRSIVYTFLSIYLRSLGLSTTEVTLMATVGMIANAGTQSFLWGKALDKYRKPTGFVVAGEVLAGFGHIFMVFGYIFFLGVGQLIAAGYVIIFALGIIEIFWSMSNVGWSALLSELTEQDERKKIMGQLSIIGGFGGIGGAYLGGFLYDKGAGFANGSIFNISAVVMIFSGILVYFAIRLKEGTQLTDSGEFSVAKIPSLSELPSKMRTGYLIFLVALIFINFGRNSIAIITSIFLADPTAFGANGAEIALYSNVGSIASMISGFLLGSVISKTDDNKVMIFGVGLAVAGISWLIIAPSFALAIMTSFLIGASHVVIESSSYSVVAKMAPEAYRGRLFAYYNATFFLSWGIAATLVAGPIADYLIGVGLSHANAYRGSFIAAIVLIAIGIVILLISFMYTKNHQNSPIEIIYDWE
ncbi:MAG: MFS transporter, partial [Candidatus Thorarchaeota archaeon]|nr:MFS transporter [Candidatus Thorarchaeota archaeon]